MGFIRYFITRLTVKGPAPVLVLAALAFLSSCNVPEYFSYGSPEPWFERKGNVGTLTISARPPESAAAGSFTVSGTAVNDYLNHLWIRVSKSGEPDYDYLVRGASGSGAYEQEIWLRYGKGRYTVSFINLTHLKLSLNGEGALSYCAGYVNTAFTVENARADAMADDWELLPSAEIQINREIEELSDEICAGSRADSDKIRAINGWIVEYLHYDHDSWDAAGSTEGRRKKQDALSTLRNGMGVCEGYANLSAALARAAGIRTRYVLSLAMNHAWLEVYVDGKWKMLDATWNDPDDEVLNGSRDSTEKYLLKEDLLYGGHYGGAPQKTRTILGGQEELYLRRWEGK
ncbi:MAG: transglutaminase-like domain-containing protein [Treponema sp.]|jgi:transglutaminase-like putative cysteine protease|nr:transglutaminase-like domain-containing protein [Treponema sp.]